MTGTGLAWTPAGRLVYAAWCHRVPRGGMLGDTQERLVRRVRDARGTILLRLYDLPVGVEVDLHGLVVNVSSHLGLPDDTERVLLRVVAAVFLDPLVALGIATVAPPAPGILTRSASTPSPTTASAPR